MIYALKLIQTCIKDHFPNLPPDVSVECTDVIISHYIQQNLKKPLNGELKGIIDLLKPKYIKIDTSGINDFIAEVSNYCREASHGATRLNTVYTPKPLSYQTLMPRGAAIFWEESLQPNQIIGICQARFSGVAPENLIFEGKIVLQ